MPELLTSTYDVPAAITDRMIRALTAAHKLVEDGGAGNPERIYVGTIAREAMLAWYRDDALSRVTGRTLAMMLRATLATEGFGAVNAVDSEAQLLGRRARLALNAYEAADELPDRLSLHRALSVDGDDDSPLVKLVKNWMAAELAPTKR